MKINTSKFIQSILLLSSIIFIFGMCSKKEQASSKPNPVMFKIVAVTDAGDSIYSPINSLK
jgi:hypothetical protein